MAQFLKVKNPRAGNDPHQRKHRLHSSSASNWQSRHQMGLIDPQKWVDLGSEEEFLTESVAEKTGGKTTPGF